MPRLERVKRGIKEFIEIWYEDNVIITRKGKVGSYPFATRKYFKDSEIMQHNFTQKVTSRADQGWTVVSESIQYALPQSMVLPRNKSLESIIQKNPEDKEAWLVYADWLSTQGDSRGEIITLFYLLNELPKTTKNQAKYTLYQYKINNLSFLEPELLQKLLYEGNIEEIKLVWKKGFIQEASFGVDKHFNKIITYFMQSNACLFLQRLNLDIQFNALNISNILENHNNLKLLRLYIKKEVAIAPFHAPYLKILEIYLGYGANCLITGYFPEVSILKIFPHFNVYALFFVEEHLSYTLTRLLDTKIFPKLTKLCIKIRSHDLPTLLLALERTVLIEKIEILVIEKQYLDTVLFEQLTDFLKLAPRFYKLKQLKINAINEKDIKSLYQAFGKDKVIVNFKAGEDW